MIYQYENQHLKETANLLDGFGIEERCPIISVVGAGGKTSVVQRLAKEYNEVVGPVVVTTTTHMRRPKIEPLLELPDISRLENMLREEEIIYAGRLAEDEKIAGFSMDFLESLRELKVPILIEADGAAGRPLKAPAQHEPVLWEKTSLLLGVAGLDAIGRPIGEVCHRVEQVMHILGKTPQDIITCEDIVKIGLSEEGMKKCMKQTMKYGIVLNKADNQERKEQAVYICRLFHEQGFEHVLVTTQLAKEKEEICGY